MGSHLEKPNPSATKRTVHSTLPSGPTAPPVSQLGPAKHEWNMCIGSRYPLSGTP